jgi:hypothetical protein
MTLVSNAYYEVGQVCLNGHPITGYYKSRPARHSKFCPDCGRETITACPDCEAPIRGEYEVPGVVSIGGSGFSPSSYCHHCGKPYPWTNSRIEALTEAIDELDELPEADREKLKASIPDVINDTPKTEAAASRFGKAIGMAGKWGGKLLSDVLAKVASEVVVHSLGLKP